MLDEIPLTRPDIPLLDQIQSPADLKELEIDQLEALAEELRLFLLYSVGQTGGHFGAGLGVVELTIALHTYLTHLKIALFGTLATRPIPTKF